jgi:integrase
MAKRQLHKLSARQTETTTAKGLHSDGGGLYLAVGDGGARSWLFVYRERGTGKRREVGLGPAKGPRKEGLPLSAARDKAAEARKARLGGIDPLASKRADRATGDDTFGAFGDALLQAIKSGFKNRKTEAEWKRALEIHALFLRPKRCRDITTDDVLEVVKPLWADKNKTARELRARIERVLDAAKAKGLRSGENPARWRGHLSHLLDKKRRKKRHHAAAPYKDVPGIVKKLQATPDTENLGAEFVILTAVRTSEARLMRVAEIDWEARRWAIPGARMKMDADHVVPLCARAIAILNAVIPKDAKPEDFVFKGRIAGRPFGENAMLNALKAVYPDMTTHGCRSSFRDWAGDMTSFPREIAEMALAHAVGDEVEQAYRRGTALDKRRQLMDAWAAYVEGQDNVVRIAAAI